MSSNSDPTFTDRLSRASSAKSALLAKFKQAQDPNNPAAIEKRQQRAAIVEARTERMAQRQIARQQQKLELARQAELDALKAAEAERAAAEQAAREAAEQVAELVGQLYKTPAEVVARVRAAMESK